MQKGCDVPYREKMTTFIEARVTEVLAVGILPKGAFKQTPRKVGLHRIS
jgi:hypothetical protein